MNRIGERMREYRRSIKMTQADFASRLGVTGAAVSAYETGNRLPSYEVLVKIANILGVSTDALLGRQSADRVVVDVTSLTPRQRSLVQDMVEEFARREPAGGMPCDVGVPGAGHPGHPAGGHGPLCPGQRLLPPPRTQLAVPGPPGGVLCLGLPLDLVLGGLCL